jgi:predicted NBD/HSP70 family sugar kinase
MKVANTMEIRLQNTLNIINDIECNPGITNTEIAQKRGLSVPTISNIVNILKNSEMVMTTGTGESSGGRRPIQLSLNPKCQYSIGVSIARHTVYVLLIDFEGHIYEKEKYYIQFEENDEYWHEIDGLIKKKREKAPVPCEVGIALPGFVDYDQKYAFDTYTLGTPTVSIDNIYRILGVHVSIGDSCRLAAMAQVFAKNDIEDNFFILLSRRVSGILFHNRSILNLKVSSLDIGAMIIDPTKKEAIYGAPGSFSELCSASRIIDILKKDYTITNYEDFFVKIEKGNLEFAKMWNFYLKNLSVAIYNIFSILKVDIVIGGEMAKYIAPYIQKVKDYIKDLSPKNIQNISLHCSIYGEYDDAYGAALEARSLYLHDKLPKMLKNSAAMVPAPTKKAKSKRTK